MALPHRSIVGWRKLPRRAATDAGDRNRVCQLAQSWPRRRCWSSDHLAGFRRDSWPLAVVHPLLACPNGEASGVVCQLACLMIGKTRENQDGLQAASRDSCGTVASSFSATKPGAVLPGVWRVFTTSATGPQPVSWLRRYWWTLLRRYWRYW